jgi:hypothetical protein
VGTIRQVVAQDRAVELVPRIKAGGFVTEDEVDSLVVEASRLCLIRTRRRCQQRS